MESRLDTFITVDRRLDPMGRREWWRTCFRWGAFAALSGIVTMLGLRATNPSASQVCRWSTCRGCGRLSVCTLSPAVAFRQILRQGAAEGASGQDRSTRKGMNLSPERD